MQAGAPVVAFCLAAVWQTTALRIPEPSLLRHMRACGLRSCNPSCCSSSGPQPQCFKALAFLVPTLLVSAFLASRVPNLLVSAFLISTLLVLVSVVFASLILSFLSQQLRLTPVHKSPCSGWAQAHDPPSPAICLRLLPCAEEEEVTLPQPPAFDTAATAAADRARLQAQATEAAAGAAPPVVARQQAQATEAAAGAAPPVVARAGTVAEKEAEAAHAPLPDSDEVRRALCMFVYVGACVCTSAPLPESGKVCRSLCMSVHTFA